MSKENKLEFGSWEIGGPRHYYREGLIIKGLKEALPSGKIVDVGCGTGSLVMKLAASGYYVVGIDVSDGCINITKSRVKQAGLSDKVTVSKGSAYDISIPDSSVDAVIAGEVLEHLKDDASAVHEFSRVIKPGGICLITVPANPNLWDVWDNMAGHVRRYKKEDLVRLFEKYNFRVESVRYWGFPVMRIYHRLLCLPWAKMTMKKKSLDGDNLDVVTKVGLSSIVTLTLGNIFRIDNFFSRLPWGIGIVFIARKNEK